MRERLEHFWCYYKWYVLCGVLVLVLALNFISQRKAVPTPELQLALVTVAEYDEDALDRLAARVEAALADEDGSAPTVQVNYYPYDADTAAAEDTARFMASSVQLAADIKYAVSCAYISDTPALQLEADARLYAPEGVTAQALGLGAEYTVLCREDTQETVEKIFKAD